MVSVTFGWPEAEEATPDPPDADGVLVGEAVGLIEAAVGGGGDSDEGREGLSMSDILNGLGSAGRQMFR
jgi:hypothetical protein